MSTDVPIAIVGRGCILPGALDVATLWSRIVSGDDLTGPATAARWRLHPAAVCADPLEPSACARGGYVDDSGFEALWERLRNSVGIDDSAAIPVGWRWLVAAMQQALEEARVAGDAVTRTGLVLGSLGYPTREFAEAAAERWRASSAADSIALTGQTGALRWAMQACGLAGPRLVLDAACASGLYALKLAADALRSGDADVMLAAGLNAADDLFLHVGFTALGALSRSGVSAPLSARADGLLPAEGAAVIVLKRLDDAVAAGDRILAVVRGVGVSNDGRATGLLSPSTRGQQRAMRAPYLASGVSPAAVDYLECHATGTPIGDAEEIASIRALFGDAHPLQLGSLKAQLGHLITASATAGVLKLCAMLEHGIMPAAPHAALAEPLCSIEGSALMLSATATPWNAAATPRRAAIDAFGFGGCNAHALLEGPEGVADLIPNARGSVSSAMPVQRRHRSIALLACELAAGGADDTAATLRVLLGVDEATRRAGEIELDVTGLGFPPADLKHAVPAQLLLLRAAQAIRPHLDGIDRDRLGVFVGADVDPAAARHGFRWRLERIAGAPCSDRDRDAIVAPLQAAGVIGTMPNMPANRLNSLFDAHGPGFVTSDGAASGLRAWECAADAIARGEIDAAVVGAVDASGAAFGDDSSRSDAAVLMLLTAADRAGDRTVLATFAPATSDAAAPVPAVPWSDSGAASDLVDLAVAALCCRHALSPSDPRVPWIAGTRVVRAHGWDVTAPEVQGLALEAPAVTAPHDTPQLAGARGELAWVFTGAAAAYPAAGLTLLRACPDLGDALYAMAPQVASALPSLLGQSSLALVEQLQVATMLSQAHARLLGDLGVTADACLGLSSGETNALLASGAWTDADDLFAAIAESGMYDQHLAGRYDVLRHAWSLDAAEVPAWRCFRVRYPVAALRTAIAERARVRLLIVHHDRDAVIGGDERACVELIDTLGADAVPVHHDLVVHCPELEPFAAAWHRVHRRPTRAVAAPRLYSNAAGGSFVPGDIACADLLTAQARDTVTFDATVQQAYADGVRTFVELGPRNACTGWIRDILSGQPHVACALDGTSGALRDAARALETIAAAGHHVDIGRWNARMQSLRVLAPARPHRATITFPRYVPPPSIAPAQPTMLRLPAAPLLTPVLPDRLHPVVLPAPVSPATTAHDHAAFAPVTDDSDASDVTTLSGDAALAALTATQHALLEAQELAVRYLLATAAETPAVTTLSFTREQLEVHAGGRISTIFGEAFAPQDGYRRQVRMPMPPLLLADRVTAIAGEAGSMGTGTVWTETDVRADAWYMHHGRMPAGILIESGQADLFLISWLGVDLHNRGDRVYRLLGCELTFHGRLPAAGETLRYEIAIDGHARHGDVGLFFFHYDCASNAGPRLSVRQGQAGFFTDAELADSAGILWDPLADLPDAASSAVHPPVVPARGYDATSVQAFVDGDLRRAFGDAFARAATHTRSPHAPGGRLQLFERVDLIDLTGGPWGRGYLRATLPITPDAWFFDGHFLNDPCMPGTLMFEGCLQAMAFYLSALGFSIARDGWSFEPVPDQPYTLRCRGQVTPQSRELVYELFVADLLEGPEPTLVADLLCVVDGLPAFHCRRMALKLAPDFPLDAYALRQIEPDTAPVAEFDRFRYGYASLLACATGHPVDAFGPLWSSLPDTLRVPRLPAPPYHFMTRVSAVSDAPGLKQAGIVADTEYDIPPDAWYFDAHPSQHMPVCVLIEAALQPCGWLAAYAKCAVDDEHEVFFRNLDGSGVLHRPLSRQDGTLRVRTRLTNVSHAGGITLVSFDVVCRVGDEAIYELTTTFGFFPKAALEGQAGLGASDAQRAVADAAGAADLLATLDAGAARHLPREPLRMCERVTHRSVAADGRTLLRGEKAVRPDEWFFRAHFFQDPVQPGSLGIEALAQLLQSHLLLAGAAAAIPGGTFCDFTTSPGAAASAPHAWQFRGQVLPEASLVTLTIDAEPIVAAHGGWTVRAEGSVWVDGLRIYHVRNLTATFAAAVTGARETTIVLDPAAQPHWLDHRPTYTTPALAGVAFVSLAMTGAADAQGLDDLVLRRWLLLDRAREVSIRIDGDTVMLAESGELLADGRIRRDAGAVPDVIAPLPETTALLDDVYASGVMFHGPAYQRVVAGRSDARGADLRVRVESDMDSRERVSHILLDAGLHGVPHHALERWFPELAPGYIGYPSRIERFRLFGAMPADGICDVRVRPAGYYDKADRMPRLLLQYLDDGRLWAELVVVETRLPATRLGQLPPYERRAFLRDGAFVSGARLSDETHGLTTLDAATVALADYLPGTVGAVYGISAAEPIPHVAAVAAREHAASRLRVHPRTISIDAAGDVRATALPLLDYHVAIAADARHAEIADAHAPRLAAQLVDTWWSDAGWTSTVPGLRPLFRAAMRQFVSGVRLIDPAAIDALRGRPVLLLANHQVGIESALAGILLPALLDLPITTVAKHEHRETWVGRLALGLNDPRRGAAIVFVDRDRPDDMLAGLSAMRDAARAGQRSVMVHVEGTRATRGFEPVRTLSAVWSDFAIDAGLAIVPLRFCGGLPGAGAPERLEFPYGFGAQELVVGRPIDGGSLADLHLNARRDCLLAGLAELEPFDFEPRPDALFGRRVAAVQHRWQVDVVRAVFLLLQAEAQGWPLDDDGLPRIAMSEGAAADPFWAWFLSGAGEAHAR